MSTKSHSSKLSTGDNPNRSPSCSLDGGAGKGKEASVSVSANNWEKLKNNSDVVENKKEVMKTRDLVSHISRSCLSDPDPSFNHHTNSEKVEGGRVQRRRRRRRRRSASSLRIETGEVGGSNFHGSHCLMEIKNGNDDGKTTRSKTKFMLKTRLKEVSNCLTTSKEIVRVLNHVWGNDQQQRPSATLSLITALKSELDGAKTRVDHLIKDHSSHGEELIEGVIKRFAEEKAAWKYRERARVRSAITSMTDEVEVEKKLRRQAQRLNKTIAKELAHTKLSLSKAIKDLQRERRGKEILEQICDELAKGIGEDRAELEEVKKESEKVREEVEKEREMLELADVLREERVQMKLWEAKYEFEEKNAAVERMREEVEAYFITQLGNENGEQVQEDYSCNKFEKIKELEAYLKKINFGSCQITKDEEEENMVVDDCSEEDENDLHSIELNMDNNNNSKSYTWSFVPAASKRNSFEKDQIDGRKFLSEKNIQWGSICFNRKPPKNGELIVGRKSHDNSDRFTELLQNEITHKNNTKSVKCLRDILFPGSAEDQTQLSKTEDGIALKPVK